jgi:EAL domain-containing protein (putative c-di-GMP-specific phosphodiesterase class I)
MPTHLKIDRGFVARMLNDPNTLSIVNDMAGLLGSHLIAEGIETVEQLALLRRMKVNSGQGFLFSGAVGREEFGRVAGTVVSL